MSFIQVFKAKTRVRGSENDTFWHPGVTFSTFENDVDFRIGFEWPKGWKMKPKELIFEPFLAPKRMKNGIEKSMRKMYQKNSRE